MECAVVAGSRRGDQEGRERELAETLTRINGATPISETDVAQARHTYGSLFLKELLAQQLSQRFGIVSFASDPRHPLMWAHYTVDGSGFAIGYDSKQIRALSVRTNSLLSVRYQKGPFLLAVDASQVFTEENANALLSLNPNPPKDTDGRRENSGRGVRELQGRWPGAHWGRWEVGGWSSVVAQGPYGRLRTLGRARWRGEDAARGTGRPEWREFAGTFGWPDGGRLQTGAVRQGVAGRAIGPGRG